MKKIFAITLVLVMMLAMSVTVFAATYEIDAISDTHSHTIQIINTVTNDPTKVYAVNVEWTDNTFTATTAKGTWDPENHIYREGTTTVVTGHAIVKVTNHSNVALNAIIGLESSVPLVTFKPDAAKKALASADAGESYGDPTKAPSVEFRIEADSVSYTTAETISVNATISIEEVLP